jgi:hypothetical protein
LVIVSGRCRVVAGERAGAWQTGDRARGNAPLIVVLPTTVSKSAVRSRATDRRPALAQFRVLIRVGKRAPLGPIAELIVSALTRRRAR